jgi:hypothetical protein
LQLHCIQRGNRLNRSKELRERIRLHGVQTGGYASGDGTEGDCGVCAPREPFNDRPAGAAANQMPALRPIVGTAVSGASSS